MEENNVLLAVLQLPVTCAKECLVTLDFSYHDLIPSAKLLIRASSRPSSLQSLLALSTGVLVLLKFPLLLTICYPFYGA